MAERSKSTICLCLLCGIPGSGKTTLATRVWGHCAEKLPSSVLTLHLHYDHLIPAHLEKQLVKQTAEQGGSHWKLMRSQVIACVDCLLNRIAGISPSSFNIFEQQHHINQSHFQQNYSRKTLLDSIQENLLSIKKPSNVDSGLWERFVQMVDNCAKRYLCEELGGVLREEADSLWLILLDDNMHYISMRYDYCQLARKYETGLCTLCVTCPIEEALRRNASRLKDRVNDHVIVQMDKRLELPDRIKRPWEKYYLIIDEPSGVELDYVLETIHQSVLDPLRPQTEEDAEGKAASRDICSTNTIHQVDQILRRCISSCMTDAKGKGTSGEDLKRLSLAFLKARTTILDEIRQGDITLPFNPADERVSDAGRQTESPLFHFVQKLFELKINTF